MTSSAIRQTPMMRLTATSSLSRDDACPDLVPGSRAVCANPPGPVDVGSTLLSWNHRESQSAGRVWLSFQKVSQLSWYRAMIQMFDTTHAKAVPINASAQSFILRERRHSRNSAPSKASG